MLLDDRPMLLRLRKAVKKLRRRRQSEWKGPKIKWEVLQDEGKKEVSAEIMRQA